MLLNFWLKTSGTWINVATVIIGTIIGLSLKQKLSPSIKNIIPQGIGLLTLWLGFSMAGDLSKVEINQVPGVIFGLMSMVVGGAFGEWWRIEDKLNHLGDYLKAQFHHSGEFTEGFVATSILFCVGPVALVGSINNGLLGDNTLLVLKAIMDGISSIPFASRYGLGVGFSALVILIYQGGISLIAGLLASSLNNPADHPIILLISGIGGLMILGIGLNLLEVAQVRVATFLPALLLAPIFYGFILLI